MDTTLQNQTNNTETEEQKQYIITKRFEDWVNAFLTKTSHTYGNATQSAITAYELDPAKQYGSAGVIGHENVKKLKNLKAMYAESKGVTLGMLTDMQLSRAMDVQNPTQKLWFDDLMVDLGYRDPKGAQIVINNANTQNSVDINAPEAIDYNKKFKQFLMNE